MVNNITKTYELKSCPMCGAKPELRCMSSGTCSTGLAFRREYKLWCQRCGLTLGGNKTVWFDFSPNTGFNIDDRELREGVELWNRRDGHAET